MMCSCVFSWVISSHERKQYITMYLNVFMISDWALYTIDCVCHSWMSWCIICVLYSTIKYLCITTWTLNNLISSVCITTWTSNNLISSVCITIWTLNNLISSVCITTCTLNNLISSDSCNSVDLSCRNETYNQWFNPTIQPSISSYSNV